MTTGDNDSSCEDAVKRENSRRGEGGPECRGGQLSITQETN